MRKYYKLLWKEILARILFHVIYISAIAALPYIIKNMIDCTYENGICDVIKWSLYFISFIVIGMAAQYITQRSSWKLDQKFYELIRQDLFCAIITKKSEEFYKKEIGEYASLLQNDVASCEEYIEYVMEICESVIDLIVYAIFIFMLDTKIAVIIYAAAIMVFFLPRITGKKLSEKKQTLPNEIGRYTNTLLDLLAGFSFVDHFTWNPINQKHKRTLHRMENARYTYGKYKTFVNVFNGSVMYVVNVAAFVIIAILLSLESISVGVATATISYIQDFMFPLRTIVDSVSSLKAVSGVKDKVLMELESKEELSLGGFEMKQELVLKEISKMWNNFKIKDFSFAFQRGKSYVIVGESGSGKSTLLKLITQNIKQDSGFIEIDGQEATYDMCHELMFYVNQNSHIYSESYQDNVTMFGSYEYREMLKEAVGDKMFHAIYESEDCSSLSGGEKQLVMICRALLSNKEILVLDEPFSALNRSLEWEITKEILRKGKTVIMVTHNADKEYLGMFDVVVRM